jgi:hypothetical protein
MIKSAYTNEWYADMPALPEHPLRRQSHIIDSDWDMESQESHESNTSTDPPTVQRQKRRKRLTEYKGKGKAKGSATEPHNS